MSQYLKESKQSEWLIEVTTSTDNPSLDKLARILSYHDASMRFAVHAPAQQTARYLRKQAPQWLYAADSASLLRLHLFESLWLETLMDFWPDFVIASPAKNKADGANDSRLSAREAQELHRRQKRILWEEKETGLSARPEFPVDGTILTGRPD